ncbi:hypothetical protein D9M68_68770 [compost metagenome]
MTQPTTIRTECSGAGGGPHVGRHGPTAALRREKAPNSRHPRRAVHSDCPAGQRHGLALRASPHLALGLGPMLFAMKIDIRGAFRHGTGGASAQSAREAEPLLLRGGAVTHLAALSFAQASDGIQMLHVPSKGGAPSIQPVGPGDVEIGTPPLALPLAQSG